MSAGSPRCLWSSGWNHVAEVLQQIVQDSTPKHLKANDEPLASVVCFDIPNFSAPVSPLTSRRIGDTESYQNAHECHFVLTAVLSSCLQEHGLNDTAEVPGPTDGPNDDVSVSATSRSWQEIHGKCEWLSLTPDRPQSPHSRVGSVRFDILPQGKRVNIVVVEPPGSIQLSGAKLK